MYQFFKNKYPELDNNLSEEITAHSHGILDLAVANKDALCKKTLDCFLKIYGSEIGDYCLKLNPQRGVYLLGGVTLGIKDYLLTSEIFKDAIFNKGRVSPMVLRIPIYIVNREIGLDGCEMYARQQINK